MVGRHDDVILVARLSSADGLQRRLGDRFADAQQILRFNLHATLVHATPGAHQARNGVGGVKGL